VISNQPGIRPAKKDRPASRFRKLCVSKRIGSVEEATQSRKTKTTKDFLGEKDGAELMTLKA
jgi:hypothetical protein